MPKAFSDKPRASPPRLPQKKGKDRKKKIKEWETPLPLTGWKMKVQGQRCRIVDRMTPGMHKALSQKISSKHLLPHFIF